MNTERTTKQIEVMQAYTAGKSIEMKNRVRSDDVWLHVIVPMWNWALMDYRIKREPREFAVVLDKYGNVVGTAAPNGFIVVGKDVKLASEGFTSIKVREVLE